MYACMCTSFAVKEIHTSIGRGLWDCNNQTDKIYVADQLILILHS